MAKFFVQVMETTMYEIVVDAENETEARKNAVENIKNGEGEISENRYSVFDAYKYR